MQSTHPATIVRLARAALLLLVLIAGCQVPRIDPSGNAIFAPGSTTLDPQLGQLPTPTPAFVAPPAPENCSPGQPGCKKFFPTSQCEKLVSGIYKEFTCVGDEGQLQLTPARLVAPVGTEVVLLAGLCGPEKTFVARQPIEWLMSQESVGNFVAVGEDGECSLTRVYKSQPKKTTGGYAVGVSSAAAATVTRGTPQPNDDFHLGRGQAWLSVTSPSEGTSYVTVLAPKAKNWDQRRQTAVIHWVDAQWSLPGPAIVPAGRKHTLTTHVTRAGGTQPAAGHFVRYEVSSGAPAGFLPGGQPSVEVPVDAQGNASVEIGQLSPQAGATSVSIQILRPGLAGDTGRTTVGQGWTSITWSAPGLAVKVSGPSAIQAGLEATFRIDITNPGDIASKDVVVSNTLPPGLDFTAANPPPQVFGNRMDWRLGDLPAKATQTITLRTMGTRGGNIRLNVLAKSADGVQSQDSFATQITQQSLSVVMSGPPTADVGEQIQYRVEIENTGDQPLSNVKLTNRFDAGLEQIQGERSPVVRSIGDLMPREKRVLGITFIVRQAGEQCHTLDASADGGQLTTFRSCVKAGVRDALSLTVKKTGPADQVVGGTAAYVIEVTNTGNKPLTNVRIIDQYSGSLEPKDASNGFAVEAGAITWSIPQLDPGKFVQRRVNCVCLKADPGAINRVTVTTNERITGTDQVSTRVSQAGAGYGPDRDLPLVESGVRATAGVESGNVNADGRLSLTITESADPTKIGQAVVYFITLANERAVSDRDVRMRITLPEGLRYSKLSGRYAASASGNGRVIDITPIAEMRPNEKLQEFKLEVIATAEGKQRLRVEANSQRSPTAVAIEEETTIFAK
ncbi:MAG TPA: hypothetical protein VL096_15230 [Pirellulaceae bacterium]|nr:hypothetical protein [Pirellulaceae bacterium]